MRTPGQADCFMIVNGPEDGAEYPVVRAPFYIGENGQCLVQVRLDSGARPYHALVTVVSDGYRVRRLDRDPVYVNGKPAGLFKSRIVRDGGLVQVGHTLVCLECSPDGLASRSHGMVAESDIGWAGQRILQWAGGKFLGGLNFVLSLLGRIVTSWLAVASILFLAYVFVPTFRFWVQQWISWIYYTIVNSF